MKNISSSKNKKRSRTMVSPSMLMPILSIFMCLVFLCSMSYAWFTATAKSSENIIASSVFDLNINVRDENGNAVVVEDNADGTHTCTFTQAGNYKVTLEMTNDTTASKGYCKLTINSTEEKQTAPISKNPYEGKNPFTFTMNVQENTVVVFEPKWGMSADPDISHNSTLALNEEPENP